MKVFILAPGENWIVDEMAKQFKLDNPEICTEDPTKADVVWVMADWCSDRIPHKFLKTNTPIVMMLHHFVPDKFSGTDEDTFLARDKFVSAYTAPNYRTRDFVSNLTDKPIRIIQYWAHTGSWKKTGTKEELRKKYGIPDGAYIVGSFQRDTEGHDLKTPKLEKGPDLLCDFLEMEHPAISPYVVLAGWRRQYVIGRLDAAGVPYKYFERPSQEVINELYQTLDLYPVTSRYEGGPQSLIECGMLEIPVVSRPVGVAECVLPSSAINANIADAVPSVPNVEHLKTPGGYAPFIELLKEVANDDA